LLPRVATENSTILVEEIVFTMKMQKKKFRCGAVALQV